MPDVKELRINGAKVRVNADASGRCSACCATTSA